MLDIIRPQKCPFWWLQFCLFQLGDWPAPTCCACCSTWLQSSILVPVALWSFAREKISNLLYIWWNVLWKGLSNWYKWNLIFRAKQRLGVSIDTQPCSCNTLCVSLMSTTRANLFSCWRLLFGSLPTSTRCILCTVTGPTVIDIHGQVNSVQDRCVYSLMKTQSVPNFQVHATFQDRRRKDVTFLDRVSLSLEEPGVYINLEQGGRVQVRHLVRRFDSCNTSVRDPLVLCLKRLLILEDLLHPWGWIHQSWLSTRIHWFCSKTLPF